MALSLDSLFTPFNEFFIQKFVAHGSPVKFRFARLPRALANADFVMPGQTDATPSPLVASEVFSAIVDNGIRLEEDGLSMWQSPSHISDVYNFEIVGPSVPYLPPELSDQTAIQARIDTFSTLKEDALRLLRIRAASVVEGAQVQYSPSYAQPTSWWDKTDPDVWTHQAFEVQGAATTDATSTTSTVNPLLRMKIDDVVLGDILRSRNLDPGDPVPPASNWRQRLQSSTSIGTLATTATTATTATRRVKSFDPLLAQSATSFVDEADPVAPAVRNTTPSFALSDHFSRNLSEAPVNARLDLELALVEQSATQPVVTNSATISFDFCVVTITRPWWDDAFVRSSIWEIPGQARSALSANDGHGLPARPVGFVAIKNLSIQAPWTAEDITNLAQSVQFGPFNFDSTVVNGAISHAGIQIVGWLLQDLSDLPPNPQPAAPPAPPPASGDATPTPPQTTDQNPAAPTP